MLTSSRIPSFLGRSNTIPHQPFLIHYRPKLVSEAQSNWQKERQHALHIQLSLREHSVENSGMPMVTAQAALSAWEFTLSAYTDTFAHTHTHTHLFLFEVKFAKHN